MLTVLKVKTERFLKSLDVNVTISKRELVLAIAAFTLLGIVIGAMFSPRKNVSIGSNNSADNNSYGGTKDEKEDEEE
ncbi:MAG: hypothetical protein J6K92_02700 [Oscillospiraceae bacterium]|nr:hypothetical protein [Oscillospiraceae bacterium]